MPEEQVIQLPPLSVIDGVEKIKEYGKRISNLRYLRNTATAVRYESGKRHLTNFPERSVCEITDEIDFWSRKQREVIKAVTQANGGFMHVEARLTGFTIPGESEPLTLGQLVIFLKQCRDGLSWLKQLYEKRTQVTVHDRQIPSGVPGINQRQEYYVINEVLYNPKDFETLHRNTERLIEAAQRILKDLNQVVKLNFVEEDYQANEKHNDWLHELIPPKEAGVEE